MNELERNLLLKFFGGEAEQHEVPAAMLAQVLMGLQRGFHLVGMMETGATVKARAKPSKEVRELYKLSCRPLREGSLEALLRVGGEVGGLFDQSLIEKGLERFLQGLSSAQVGDPVGLAKAVPDRTTRQGFLRAIDGTVPDQDSEVQFALFVGDRDTGDPAVTSVGLSNGIQQIRQAAQVEPETQTLAGVLSKISFENNTIELWYPPTKRQLTCSYQPEVEEMLLSHPRDLLRVTGRVILDDQGHPSQIVDVHAIEELDLTPISLHRFSSDGKPVSLRVALEYTIEPDQDYQILRIQDDELDILLEASTREELLADLLVEWDVLWHNYALAPDDSLTAGAQRLKRSLLQRVEPSVGQ